MQHVKLSTLTMCLIHLCRIYSNKTLSKKFLADMKTTLSVNTKCKILFYSVSVCYLVMVCTEMQENTWDSLRELSMHQGASHATEPTYFPAYLYICFSPTRCMNLDLAKAERWIHTRNHTTLDMEMCSAQIVLVQTGYKLYIRANEPLRPVVDLLTSSCLRNCRKTIFRMKGSRTLTVKSA